MSRRRPFAYSSAILLIIASSTKLAIMFRNGVVSSHRIVRNGSKETALIENVASTRIGVDLFELYVVLLPEKSERRRKSPRTNAGDETKYGTIAASAPAGKKSGTEGPIVTPARYCEKVVGWQLAVVGSLRSFVGLEAKGRHALRVRIRVKPGIGNINIDLGRDRKWNRGKPIGARTSNDNKIEPEQNDEWKRKAAKPVSASLSVICPP